MMTAWIMFENHTFQQVRATYSKIAGEIKKVADAEKGMFGGWGRLTFDGISSDDFALIGGLHKIEELSQIKDINFAQRIDDKLKIIEESITSHEATITKQRDAITKLQVLRSTVKSIAEEIRDL